MKKRPFYVKDCSLITIALGLKAQTLIELRDKIALIPNGSLYTHFWDGRFTTNFKYSEYHNDFSIWSYSALHDSVLAERLDSLNPINYDNLEDLRRDLLEIIEEHLEEKENTPISKRDEQFGFARSKIVVFDTSVMIHEPQELPELLPHLSQGTLFYHIIDAKRREPNKTNDFSVWLQNYSPLYDELIDKLNKIDPYFISLTELKQQFTKTVKTYFSHG